MSLKGEQSICQARASVMIYDDTSKKWVPIKPGQQGFSRINIYHNTTNNTFRVVGVKLQDQQVVINYSIVKGLKYNQATPTFHQWRDARQVYGLNFASKEEATTFSTAMLFALNVLSSQDAGPAGHRQNGPVTDETDAQRRQMMDQHQMQVERERRTSGSAVSTLQFKVSASASHCDTPSPDSRQFRANTLPSSSTRLSPSLPSSSSKEQESGYRTVDSSHKKAQRFSQLSTSLPSAFSPVQPGGVLPFRNVRQIPLSPPTAPREPDQSTAPKHGTWSSTHTHTPLATTSSPGSMSMPIKQPCTQPVLPVALPLSLFSNGPKAPISSSNFDPTALLEQPPNGQHEDCYHFQALPPQAVSSSASPHPHYCQPEPFYYEAIPLSPLIGQPAQGHTHQTQVASSFQPQPHCHSTPPSYTSVSEGPLSKMTTPLISQDAIAPTSPSLPPGHPSMLSSTPPLHPPAPVPAVGPPAPPPPPGPPPPATAPLPIPPPLPAGGGLATSGLAAALAGAKLRKVPRPEEGTAGLGSTKNDASRSSGGSGGGGEGLMQEMNALLARRRKASEKPEDSQNEEANGSPGSRGSSQQNSTDAVKKPWERANSSDKSSAGSRLRPVGSSTDAELADFDRMKQEILEEVVRELHKVKDEIIDAIRRELTRMGTT
ncbi:enah/Vasp-like a isoform X2 [Electrophorus electricus]|uniref:enah/Vasp-like a isoform X2 n=1 Tax=Electrophorus electricus TaxID=8005 RepID=UPI000F09EFAE|nr:enah/Vasp-like a isoform X2 [Electrophorus electricus]